MGFLSLADRNDDRVKSIEWPFSPSNDGRITVIRVHPWQEFPHKFAELQHFQWTLRPIMFPADDEVYLARSSQIMATKMKPTAAMRAQQAYALGMAELTVDRQLIARRGRRLEYFTIAWNTLEGLVAVVAGAFAGSISLVGFGVDSFIEVTSGIAVLWRMSVDSDIHSRERNERLALKIVGICFLGLAIYIGYESTMDLVRRNVPESSLAGIILAAVSLIAMPLLSRAKRRVGNELRSPSMKADAKQTEFCTWLSAILLGGLLLNSAFGVWWADPVAALIMVPIIAKEGYDGLQGKACDSCH